MGLLDIIHHSLGRTAIVALISCGIGAGLHVAYQKGHALVATPAIATPAVAAPVQTWTMNAPRYRNDPVGESFKATQDRERIPCPSVADRSAVIFVFGQSNSANQGEPGSQHVATGPVINFNPYDGNCYRARDPMLGASGNNGSFVARLGDQLTLNHTFDRVVFITIGEASFISYWTPEGNIHYPKLIFALRQAKAAGLTITHMLWQQGEQEGAYIDADGEAYQRSFRSMLASIRAQGVMAPIYVAQSTICRTLSNPIITGAQKALVDDDDIRAGPNTDLIGFEDRYDGCHMKASGLDRMAKMWADILAKERASRKLSVAAP
jgi:hypothetical protein